MPLRLQKYRNSYIYIHIRTILSAMKNPFTKSGAVRIGTDAGSKGRPLPQEIKKAPPAISQAAEAAAAEAKKKLEEEARRKQGKK